MTTLLQDARGLANLLTNLRELIQQGRHWYMNEEELRREIEHERDAIEAAHWQE